MPAFHVRIRTKINLQKVPLRFDKLFMIAIMKMSFLRGGAAKGLAVPPHFCKNPNFSVGQFSSKNSSFLISKKTYKLSQRKAVATLWEIAFFTRYFHTKLALLLRGGQFCVPTLFIFGRFPNFLLPVVLQKNRSFLEN